MSPYQAASVIDVSTADRSPMNCGQKRRIRAMTTGTAMALIAGWSHSAGAALSEGAGPFVEKGALMCISLESFARGLMTQQWNNAPLPQDCVISSLERTSVTDVRISTHPRAAVATIKSTGRIAFVESFYVHIPGIPRAPSKGLADPTQQPRVIDEISYFNDYSVLQLSQAAKESESQSGIRVYVYLTSSFGGLSREAFAAEVARNWRLNGADGGNFLLWTYGEKENEGYLEAGAGALTRLGRDRVTAIHNGTYQVAQQRVNNLGASFLWMMQAIPKHLEASSKAATDPVARNQASAPDSTDDEDSRMEVVRAFYLALGRGDGATANSLMTLEKRASPAFQPDAIEAFYGQMAEPLTLVSVEATGTSDYSVHYRYRKTSASCVGHAVVTTQDVQGRALIARIKPLGKC